MTAKAQVSEASLVNVTKLKKVDFGRAATQLFTSQLVLVLEIIPPLLESSVFP